ncbi:MAG: hypothetical protein K1X67_07080 [Fimbriimonadaceae bacterium]|nr:hypothetical protein [Fimbriimonadaceae bacterium]
MLTLLAACIGIQGGINPSTDVFLDGDKAYLLTPPQVISDYTENAPIWSSDGKYVLCTTLDFSLAGLAEAIEKQAPPAATWDLVLWSASTRKSTVVATIKSTLDRMPRFREAGWLKGSPTAYGILETTQVTPEGNQQVIELVRVSPGAKAVRTEIPTDGQQPYLAFSPNAATALLVNPQPNPQPTSPMLWNVRLTALGANGPISSEVIANSLTSSVAFAKDGRRAMILKGREWRSMQDIVVWEPGRGVSPATELPDFKLPPEPRLVLSEEPLQLGKEANKTAIPALWVGARPTDSTPKDEKTAALVGTDAPFQLASVSPKGDAVLYVSKGVAMVRTLVEVPKSLLNQAKGSADKTKAISDAKQCALAAIMFAADNDDEMPKQGETEKLYPYLKNRDIMARFVYTFGGGNLKDIQSPSTTEIGYVEGPGGRAVAYADGHVKWISN